ncbi:chorismate mutase [Brevundimonas sp.]|uniref:chorismate mutase n=1 Tax=Brevundimonas sp. TaxID=1871086 RepID=UPI002BE99E89|nr:chorismate mutase [Brevundimonas sp.]HWQ87297.1 chorismate mutase [Brevundimonas sp.]
MTDPGHLKLAALRAELDALDRRMVETLARRQGIVEAVARLKGDPARVRDPARVEAVLANVLQAAGLAGLSAAIAEPVWRLLVERCADHEAAWLEAQSGAPHDSCCGCQDGSSHETIISHRPGGGRIP